MVSPRVTGKNSQVDYKVQHLETEAVSWAKTETDVQEALEPLRCEA